MTVQQIHEFIWQKVLDRKWDYGEWATRNVTETKIIAISKLYGSGLISDRARSLLHHNNHCVLCALYRDEGGDGNGCDNCPMMLQHRYDCMDERSLWNKSTNRTSKWASDSASRTILSIDVLSGGYMDEEAKEILENERE